MLCSSCCLELVLHEHSKPPSCDLIARNTTACHDMCANLCMAAWHLLALVLLCPACSTPSPAEEICVSCMHSNVCWVTVCRRSAARAASPRQSRSLRSASVLTQHPRCWQHWTGARAWRRMSGMGYGCGSTWQRGSWAQLHVMHWRLRGGNRCAQCLEADVHAVAYMLPGWAKATVQPSSRA